MVDTLTEMQQDLQSSISYAGGNSIDAIRKCDYVLVKNSIYNGDSSNQAIIEAGRNVYGEGDTIL